jgi:hypothetical protein
MTRGSRGSGVTSAWELSALISADHTHRTGLAAFCACAAAMLFLLPISFFISPLFGLVYTARSTPPKV